MIKEVRDVIQELSRDGMTSVVVTHEMAFARRVAAGWSSWSREK